jgi:hypothetical protein
VSLLDHRGDAAGAAEDDGAAGDSGDRERQPEPVPG